jgi:crossover junction endodeoxyribonuclease RusA
MTWELTDKQRPWTTNAERSMHYMKRAALIKDCRPRFFWLAKQHPIPALKRIKVHAYPLAKDRRWRPDVAACYPAVKAAIDGMVDAGVIPDDNDTYLASITFYPVQIDGYDGLRIVIEEA